MSSNASTGLRIVAFHNLGFAYRATAAWAERMGHTLSLVVTTPGPTTRRSTFYQEILTNAPPGQDILVTTRIRRVALPLIKALEPDLILSFTFPYLLPPEILAIPKIAAVNLHPTLLPRYRGPNPMRVFYDGAPTIGATVHYLDADFDTGNILSQAEGPMPETPTAEALVGTWSPLVGRALAEGVARAVAGDPGTPQDHTYATYSPDFAEEERWLDWQLTQRVLAFRVVGLNLARPTAKAMIGGEPYRITRLEPVAGVSTVPGTILDHSEGMFTIGVADGAVRVSAEPITD